MKVKFAKGDIIAERVGKDGFGRQAVVVNTALMSNNQVFLHLYYADGTYNGSAQQAEYALVTAAADVEWKLSERELAATKPSFIPVDPDEGALSNLRRLADVRNEIDAAIIAEVARSRQRAALGWGRKGATWSEIGHALGVTGQAAGQKFGAK